MATSMPRVAAGLQVPHPRDRDCLLPSLPFTSREFRISPIKPDMQRAPFAANSWLLTREDLVAVEIFTLYPRAPRARLRLAEKLHAQRLHPRVVADTVRIVLKGHNVPNMVCADSP